MAFTPEQKRNYRRNLRSRNICTYCAKRPVVGGSSVCKSCQKQRHKQRDEYRSSGLRCHDCARELTEYDLICGGSRCMKCLERHNTESQKRIARGTG